MSGDMWTKLRAPFPPEQIGKLPKGGVQLDFVGHADVTDRLLNVDPEWTWEPMATTPEGLPCLDQFGNLWIRLTIGGVTRIGVGDGKSMKECIGDAIRNGAMRFGVALDLWAKGDRSFGLAGHDAPAREQTVRPGLRRPPVEAALEDLADLCAQRGLDAVMVAQEYADGHEGRTLRASNESEIRSFIALVRNGEASEPVLGPVPKHVQDAARNPDDPEAERVARLAEAKERRDIAGVDSKGRRKPEDGPPGERSNAVDPDDPWHVHPAKEATS